MEQQTWGNFTFSPTSIEGLVIVDVRAYGDSRGSFMETYQKPCFEKAGICCDFVQDNHSTSIEGVLRGLHFQIEYPQAKLVYVIRGEVFDVAVDLRPGSPTFGKWDGVLLSAENRRELFIPRGFAHGFLALSDVVEFCYKCDDVYHPGDEGGIIWDDPDIGIDWPIPKGAEVILSKKDRLHPRLAEIPADSLPHVTDIR